MGLQINFLGKVNTSNLSRVRNQVRPITSNQTSNYSLIQSVTSLNIMFNLKIHFKEFKIEVTQRIKVGEIDSHYIKGIRDSLAKVTLLARRQVHDFLGGSNSMWFRTYFPSLSF